MALIEKLSEIAERAEKLDAPAAAVARALEPVMSKPVVRKALSGTWLGHPVHPVLVTMPIGAWSAASVLDLRNEENAARQLVGLGFVAALPTAAAGISDRSATSGVERRMGLVHAIANTTALSCYGMSYVLRAAGRHRQGAAVALLGATAMSVGGYLGGHMTYALGVGVDAKATPMPTMPES